MIASVSRRAARGLMLVICLLVALPVVAAPAPVDRAALDKALKTSRDPKQEEVLATCLREACATPAATDVVMIVLSEGTAAQRLIGAGVAAEKLPVAGIVQCVQRLQPSAQPDERRWLLRALGTRSADVTTAERKQVVGLLEAEVRGSNPAMRVAALSSLADLGSADSLDLLIGQVTVVPAMQESWNRDRDSPVQMTRLGVVEAMTGKRFLLTGDLKSWWNEHAATVRGTHPDPMTWTIDRPAPMDVSRTGTMTRSFVVSVQDWPKGDVSDPLADAIDAAAATSRNSAASVFGRVYIPTIKMAIAEKNAFAKYGATSTNYAGYAQGQRVVMQPPTGQLSVFAGVLVHEYGHIIHQAQYATQPRWLSEGLAESIARSARGSPFAGRGPKLSQAMRQRLKAGAVSGLVQWTAEGSTNESGDLYSHAHMAVDFLRFGPIASAAAKFNGLMGRLDRGESATTAIKAVYGCDPKDLDQRMLDWLDFAAAPGK
ncbi:MAG: HEAT repeat domain-containing protein [Phycisphaerales bacterium]